MIGWRCPVCQLPLESTASPWRCATGHSFDLAKEGYTNLLLANQKRRAEPGDNRAMLTARRDFLNAGSYGVLAQALIDSLSSVRPGARLLDLGCGEGYYLDQLAKALPGRQFAGVDISREALRLAGRRDLLNCQLSVASSKRLPLQADQFEAVICVFAPFDAQEVRRVLRRDGKLWLVSPGPEHLQALKQVIYDEVRRHDAPTTPVGFKLKSRARLQCALSIKSGELFEQLLAMTPFHYKFTPEKRAQLLQRAPVIGADFYLSEFVPVTEGGARCD